MANTLENSALGVGTLALADYSINNLAVSKTLYNTAKNVLDILINHTSQVPTYLSNGGFATGLADTFVGAAAPFIAPVLGGCKFFKALDKGIYHGIEKGSLWYGGTTIALSYAGLLSNPYGWSLLGVGAGMFGARKLYTDVIPNLYSTICTKSSLCYKGTKKGISNIMPWNWGKKK